MKRFINWINGIENTLVLCVLPTIFMFGGTFLPLIALGKIIERKYSFISYIFTAYCILGFINLCVSVYFYFIRKYKDITLVEDCMCSYLLGNGAMFSIMLLMVIIRACVS